MRVRAGKAGTARALVSVGSVGRQPPLQSPGALGTSGGKIDLPPLSQRTKKEGQNPKVEQLSEMQLRHQSPVRDFVRKLRGNRHQ